MATAAFAALVLATLVLLGRPPTPLRTRALPGAAVRGALVLSRLSDRRRERLLTDHPRGDHGAGAHRSRSADLPARATTP